MSDETHTEADDFYDDDPRDDDEEDGFGFTEEDCGRWRNSRLSSQCLLAGTEECDWECPIGWRGDR